MAPRAVMGETTPIVPVDSAAYRHSNPTAPLSPAAMPQSAHAVTGESPCEPHKLTDRKNTNAAARPPS